MKISLKWLSDYIDLDDFKNDPRPLAAMLTTAGLEVESIEDKSRQFQNVVVGLILELNRHPDSDRLTVCQVTTGEGVVHQIVCGASNHKQGDRVVVSLPGAVLPGNFEIRKSKIRGVESQGMLCSETELAIADMSEGIMILPSDAPIGKPFAEYLGLDDVVFELKVTPNRADCLSHYGLARELGCLLNRELKPIEASVSESGPSTRELVSLEVATADLCPRFTGRVIRGVRIGNSPLWLKQRLESVGLRSINNVVDVTNYVMMELGQPLHAYDLRDLEGHKIRVDRARAGETFTNLYAQTLTLSGEELMIRDEKKPVGLAGIVGGANSGIKDDSQDVFVEAAYFLQSTVRRTSRQFGLNTDASYRFTRGIDVDGVFRAMNRACHLILQVAGGVAAPEAYDFYPKPVESVAITIDAQTVSHRLGYTVDEGLLIDWMKRLGCQVATHGSTLSVTPPSFRWDLTMDMDLVEEFARLHGYDHIPESLPPLEQSPSDNSPQFDFEARLCTAMQGQGFSQAVNFSFTSSKMQSAFLGDLQKLKAYGLETPAEPVRILNPLSDQSDVMRTAVAPALAHNMVYNFRQGMASGQLFEVGFAFAKTSDGYRQEHRLALAAWGHEQGVWQKPTTMPTVFTLKTALENVLRALGINRWQWMQKPDVPDFLHPGQAAGLFFEGKMIGFIGTLHPLWREQEKLRVDAALGEINLELLGRGQPRIAKVASLSKFPAVERDLAFVMPADLASGEIITVMEKAAKPWLNSVQVFDFYQGTGLEPGQKSVAFRLRYQDPEATLTDERIKELQNKVIDAVGQKFSIQVR